MHRYRVSPLGAFVLSNPISLLYLVIAILSFKTGYVYSSHLTDICNTIFLIFLIAFAADSAPSPNINARASNSSPAISPSLFTCTPLSPHTSHGFLHYVDPEGPDSFLDLSSEESFQDSGIGTSISSQEGAPSGDEETGGAARFTSPPKVPATNSHLHSMVGGGPLQYKFTPSSSESSFHIFIRDTPGSDQGENEEYVTLGVMALPRGSTGKRLAELREGALVNLTHRLTNLHLGSDPSESVGEVSEVQPTTHRTKLTLVGSVAGYLSFPIPAAQNIPKLEECCELASATFASSWENHECLSTFRRFIRPIVEDSLFRSTRLAVDNLTHPRHSHYLLPNQPARHHILSNVFNRFGSIAERYFQSRIHDGVIVYKSAFGVVDFRSEEEAHAAFLSLQGRRIRGEMAHWRLEFLDPEDMSFGDRLPIVNSEPPWELIRQVDSVTCEPGRTDNILCSPLSALSVAPLRAVKTLSKKRRRHAELYRQPVGLDENGDRVGVTLVSTAKSNVGL